LKTDHYILNEDGKPVPEPDLFKWGEWFETAERRVARSEVGNAVVSTVFLGLDHNWWSEGPPILWETMVFGGKCDQEQERCAGSREQAEAMHVEMVEKVKQCLI